MVDGYLNFDTRIDTKGFEKGLGNVQNGLKSIKSILGQLATAALAAFSIKAVVDFGKKAVESAAEVRAANAQMEQTFGDLYSTADAAMKRVADQSGIVQTRLNGVGTSIYAFAKASGMDSATAMGMMEDALAATADSAAYYDRSLEDTAESLRSFLKGNYANDAALGISCTETTRNIAANKLYSKSFQDLSEAQKQLVLLQMVKDANALSGAEGQAAREAEGWENVIGNLKETWKQFQAVIGQPILSAATIAVKNITSALAELTAAASSAIGTIGELFGIEMDGASDAAASISAGVTQQDSLTDSVEETTAAQQKSLAGFDKINKLSGSSGAGTVSAGSSPAAVTPVVSDKSVKQAANKLSQKIQRALKPVQIAWEDNSAALISNAKRAVDAMKSLFKSAGRSLAEVWENGSGERFAGNIIVLFSDIIGIIGDMAEALKNAWNDDDRGTKLIQSYADRWNAFLEVIHAVAGAAREAWSDGTGESILGHILGILTNINNTVSETRQRFIDAWSENNTGADIMSGILGIMDIIIGTIDSMTESTADWAKTLDFTPLLTSISKLLKAVKPLVKNIGDGLKWFLEKVLQPLAKYTISNLIPNFLNILSGALNVLNAVIKAVQPIAQWLFDNFLSPLANWTGGIVSSALSAIASALESVSNWISENQVLVQDFVIVVGTLGAAFKIASIIEAATAAMTAAGGVMGILTGVTTALGGAVTFLTSPITLVVLAIAAVIAAGVLLVKHWDDLKEFAKELWDKIVDIFKGVGNWFSDRWQDIKNVFANIGSWFSDKFQNALDSITQVFSGIGSWFSDRWNDITTAFSVVSSWFGNIFTSAWNNIKSAFSGVGNFFSGVWDGITSVFSHVTDWFRDKFSEAWQAVKNVFSAGGEIFSGIAENIASVFKDIVNSLIDGINWVIAQPFDAINDALDGIRDVEIMDWEPFSWLPTISVPEIPHLANGTVVPANYGNFLAVLGDNKHEPEVVSPISKIEEAVDNVMQRYNSSGNSPKEIVVNTYLFPNSAAWRREVVRVVEDDRVRRGR